MARGKQKEDAQKKKLKKLEKERKQKNRKGGLAAGDGVKKTTCKKCYAQVTVTSKNTLKLQEHLDSRHPKCSFAECFPDQTPEARAKTASAEATPAPKYKADKPLAEKKKKKKFGRGR